MASDHSIEIEPQSQSLELPINRALTFTLLYLIGLGLGLYRLQSRPASEYNWESYSMRGLLNFVAQPSGLVLKVNEGLMTTSGESIVLAGPAWVTFTFFGESFLSLRLAALVIAALAVPLTWLLGRMLWSDSVGLAGALIVATSQVFLLYARTGTIVGLSIAPAVLGYILLWKTMSSGTQRWWLWLLLLQASLIGNSYFYSPIRFLWPIAVVLLLVELPLRPESRLRFSVSLGLTCAALPIALLFMSPLSSNSPIEAVKWYYNGRGEQIFYIDNSRDDLIAHLPVEDPQDRGELEGESTNALALKFIENNARDLGNLLIDRNTNPAIRDFWNPSGRLYSKTVVPLFLVSMLTLVLTLFKSEKSRYLLSLFWGFSLPLLLTSNVHIGRLVFVVPLLALLVAMPVETTVRLTARMRPLRGRIGFQRWAPLVLAAAVVVLAAVPSLRDWFGTPFERERSTFVAEQISVVMREDPTEQYAYVFGDLGAWEIESLRASVLRIDLKGAVRWVDVQTGETVESGPIPILYHGLLTSLQSPESIPGYCTNYYIVETQVIEQFNMLTDTEAVDRCGAPLKALFLPG